MHATTQDISAGDTVAQWEQKLSELDTIGDRLGRGIDPGIKETVAVLQLLGLHTCQSCEGHVDHGVAAPWVALESADPRFDALRDIHKDLVEKSESLEEDDDELDVVYEEMLVISDEMDRIEAMEFKKLIPFLEEFYCYRTVPYEQRLILDIRGRLTCQGALLQPAEEKDAQAHRLHAYQREMRIFTEFLKRKFFS